jgi:hypothetical protein
MAIELAESITLLDQQVNRTEYGNGPCNIA